MREPFIVTARSWAHFDQAMRKAGLNPRTAHLYTGQPRQIQGLPEGTVIYGIDGDLNLELHGHIHNRQACFDRHVTP